MTLILTSYPSSGQGRALALNLDECRQLFSLLCNGAHARADVKLLATEKIAEIRHET